MLRLLTGGVSPAWYIAGGLFVVALGLSWGLYRSIETIGAQKVALEASEARADQLEDHAREQAFRVERYQEELVAAERMRSEAEFSAAEDRARVARARSRGGANAAAREAANIFNGFAPGVEE